MSPTDTLDSRRESKLATIRALLAKAESTDFADEARALSAKAQELMARYSLSAMQVSLKGATDDVVSTVVIDVERPYQSAKGLILARVADANRCLVVEVSTSEGRRFHLTGFTRDTDGVQMLFTSLLVQAAREMLSASPPAWVNLRSFRHAFLVGYSTEIGKRLSTEARSTEEAVVRESGSDLLPVLADRRHAVARELERQWGGSLRSSRVTYRSDGGYSEGRRAGRQADLGGRRLPLRRALAGRREAR